MVASSWALKACAGDPAMREAFVEAGGKGGWVTGSMLRSYCEREGLMRTRKDGPGVAKSALAHAWDLADVSRDERGLSFDEFCVFMHLLCIATAGGVLPTTLPEELKPVREQERAEEPVAPEAVSPPPQNDEELARALQDAYNDELRVTEDDYRFDADSLRDLALAQGSGGLVELDGTLFACDEAIENERWSPGSGFSGFHLLPTDVANWSSEDGSISSPERDFVAPSRDSATWQLRDDWRVHISNVATDPYGWAYCRGLPSPLAPGASFAMSPEPFAGAVARRRRWTRISSRSLVVVPSQQQQQQERPARHDNAGPPPLLARLQDSFKLGVSELNRRFNSNGSLGAHALSPTPKKPSPLISTAKAKWQSSKQEKKALNSFCNSFESEIALLSDEARANRIKSFVSQSALSLRSRDRSLAKDDQFFEDVVDELEADLYRTLNEYRHDLVLETGPADVELAIKLERLQPVTPDMLDAIDVEAVEPHWPRAVDSIRSIPRAHTPRRKVAHVRSAVDDIFACLAARARELSANQRVPSSEAPQPPGADDLLPLVILATLRARPANLLADIKFVELYGENRLSGEEFFLLTQLAAAASFLQNCDATQLKGMSTESFEALMGDAIKPKLLSATERDSRKEEDDRQESRDAVTPSDRGREEVDETPSTPKPPATKSTPSIVEAAAQASEAPQSSTDITKDESQSTEIRVSYDLVEEDDATKTTNVALPTFIDDDVDSAPLDDENDVDSTPVDTNSPPSDDIDVLRSSEDEAAVSSGDCEPHASDLTRAEALISSPNEPRSIFDSTSRPADYDQSAASESLEKVKTPVAALDDSFPSDDSLKHPRVPEEHPSTPKLTSL